MRPVRLQIEGFTSFRSPQEIDFSELDLFVITGATGSGKTSILDAVTLALYGNVPRTNKHELKELISLGASQAKVQLDFEVDRDLYRVARRLPKSGAQSATIERLEDGEPISEVDGSGVREANARIEEIVGLDYDAFTRAVLLPQGDFAEFLKGDASERRNMLIRLLDLDRFTRAGKLAGERARALDQEVTTGEELLEREYGDVGKEAIEEAREKAESLKDKAGTVEGANREAKFCWETRQGLRRRSEALEEVSEKLVSHARELDRLDSLWNELGKRDPATAAAQNRTREARKAAEKKHRKAKLAWQEVRDEVGDDAVLAELAETAKTLAESEKTIEENSDTLEETEAEREEQRDHRRKLAERLETAQAAEQESRDVVEKTTAAVTSARESLERARERAALVERLAGQREREASLRSEINQAEAVEAAAIRTLEETTRRLEVLETEDRAAAIRVHLHVGDDCPVCGSEIDDLPKTDEKMESELTAARSARADAERALHEAGKSVSALRSALDGVVGAIRDVERNLEELGNAAPLPEAEAALEDAEAEEREARTRLEAAVKEAKEALAELNKQERILAQFDTKLSERRKHLASIEEKARRCRARLVDVLGESPPAGYAKVVSDRQTQLKEAAADLKAVENALTEAREAHEQAASDRTGFERELQEFDSRLRSQRSLLGERGETLGRVLEHEVPTPPTESSDDRAAALAGLDRYRQTLQGLTATAKTEHAKEITESEARVRVLLTDAEIDVADASLPVALKALEKEAGNVRLEAERAKDALKLLRERMARKREMLEELAEKRKETVLYKKVASELRRDRFISFLLDESFQDLALRASSELEQISDGRYSLAAEEDKFAVVDHANADERRSVVTLSGGETFLASLSLALGLAQGITDIAGHSAAARLESMFIDEGFGTLDPTALDLAVEALERLREGERMVGVITHVSALAERIPTGITVEKQGGGSTVELR